VQRGAGAGRDRRRTGEPCAGRIRSRCRRGSDADQAGTERSCENGRQCGGSHGRATSSSAVLGTGRCAVASTAGGFARDWSVLVEFTRTFVRFRGQGTPRGMHRMQGDSFLHACEVSCRVRAGRYVPGRALRGFTPRDRARGLSPAIPRTCGSPVPVHLVGYSKGHRGFRGQGSACESCGVRGLLPRSSCRGELNLRLVGVASPLRRASQSI